LLDTAGIRDSDDPVEREGVRRALARAAAADLVLWVIDPLEGQRLTENTSEKLVKTETWTVLNKADLAVDKLWINCESPSTALTETSTKTFAISALTGSGIDALIGPLSAYAEAYFASTESALVTRARHRHALEETVAALDRALAVGASGHEELIAEELRAAGTTLGRLTGRVDVEDILDVIFRDFCIGK
jgi:tRNA modification GTPase